MQHFIHSLGDSLILFLILCLIVLILIIDALWFFLKSAISRGVEDGIYNAVVKLHNKGIINKTILEAEEIKQRLNPHTPPTEKK
ncbi:MAG: hypothetical protein IJB96_03545 [Lachnospira sp.]|nr:hypothetical protein [Lachnospira sp.]